MVFISSHTVFSYFHLTSSNSVHNFKPLSLPAETTWQRRKQKPGFFPSFVNDSNPNAAAAEIEIKTISSVYSKPQTSGDFIPPQVILLKFKHSNNMHRLEWECVCV